MITSQQERVEGISPSIRSCKSCSKVAVCKLFEIQAIHSEKLKETAKRSGITLDIFDPEFLGARCSEYSGVEA